VSNQNTLCGAISSMRLVRFYYEDEAPGFRIVERLISQYKRAFIGTNPGDLQIISKMPVRTKPLVRRTLPRV